MTQPPEPQPREGGGSGLSAKIGPLPTWAWIGVAAVGGIVVILWLRSRSNTQQAATPGSEVSPSTADVANLQDQLATVESQIRNLQGANSTPIDTGNGNGPTPTDSGIYYFGIDGDADPSKRYIGIPGIGYYWVPDIGTAQQYLNSHPQTISLGQISQSEAVARFRQSLPWSTFGQGGAPQQFGPTSPVNIGPIARPLYQGAS